MKPSHSSLLALGLLACLPQILPAKASSPGGSMPGSPNIVLILADDLGYGDLTAYNPESKIPTPHMDRLAETGIRFTRASAPASICCPSRYGLLTGRYSWRGRLKQNVIGGYDTPLLEADRETLGTLLKKAGYQNAYVGKWHLGVNWTLKNGQVGGYDDWGVAHTQKKDYAPGWQGENIDFTQPIKQGPMDNGFDYYFGIIASNNMPPFNYILEDRVVGEPIPSTEAYAATHTWQLGELMPDFTRHAVDWIKDHHANAPETPFFLLYSATAPHEPCVPSEAALGKSGAGLRGDSVYDLDLAVGSIIETLEALEIDANTLVILTSDNGPLPGDFLYNGRSLEFQRERPGPDEEGAYETYGHQAAGPFRGYKSHTWKGGFRVPFIVKWPSVLEGGQESDQLLTLTDLLRTFAIMHDLPLAADAGEDSFPLPELLPGHPVTPRDTLITHSAFGVFSFHHGNWRYIENCDNSGGWLTAPGLGIPDRGTQPNPALPSQLFDLSRDAAESHNRIAEHPERAQAYQRILDKQRASGYSYGLEAALPLE